MALHRNAVVGDRHSPYNWEFADATARAAETIAAADVYTCAIQEDDLSVWTAIATGAGADKWVRAGGDPLYTFTGATAARDYALPDADAAIFTDKTKADVLQAAEFAADAGANDTYVITLAPAITAYVTGARYRFKANTANTGAATLNINALGAKTIKKVDGGITTDLDSNDIRAGQWVEVCYDGTNLQMLSQLGNAPTGTGGGDDFLTVQAFS
jgi:hypothetical protein